MRRNFHWVGENNPLGRVPLGLLHRGVTKKIHSFGRFSTQNKLNNTRRPTEEGNNFFIHIILLFILQYLPAQQKYSKQIRLFSSIYRTYKTITWLTLASNLA